jgi:hypothetical protein
VAVIANVAVPVAISFGSKEESELYPLFFVEFRSMHPEHDFRRFVGASDPGQQFVQSASGPLEHMFYDAPLVEFAETEKFSS